VPTTGGEGRRTVRRLGGTAYGRRFELTIPAWFHDAVTARLVGTRWDLADGDPEATWRLRHRPGAGWQAMRDGRPLSGAEGPDGAVERLVADIERWIAMTSTDVVFLHAGVVSRRGRALVLPGSRLAGRTTLVAALVRSGAGYLSDLYAVLDEDGRVHPYPRPLPLGRPATPGPYGGPHALATGPPPDAPPIDIGMVARLAYHPGGWRAEPLTRGQATLALIDAAVTGEARTAEVAAVATAAVRGAVAMAGTRGDAGTAARRLLDLMDAAFPASGHGAGHTAGPAIGPGIGPAMGPAMGPPAGPEVRPEMRHEARTASHSSSRIEWTTESRQAPRTKT
jgi:hypothetical protein